MNRHYEESDKNTKESVSLDTSNAFPSSEISNEGTGCTEVRTNVSISRIISEMYVHGNPKMGSELHKELSFRRGNH